MITSTSNEQVKNIIKLNTKTKARREQGLFVVEGVKMFCEAPRQKIAKAYVTPAFLDQVRDSRTAVRQGWPGVWELLGEIPYEVVDEKVFGQMSDTSTPQGILTLVEMPCYTSQDLLGTGIPLLVVLEDLQDPGNLGTILRTAEGAGATGILMSRNCVDLFNPKTIRSTMGSVYRMPWMAAEDLGAALRRLRERGICSYAAHLGGSRFYDQESYTGGTAFLIGNESRGLSSQLAGEADRLLRIPMEGQVESLNAAMAAGILLYEASRQRRIGK